MTYLPAKKNKLRFIISIICCVIISLSGTGFASDVEMNAEPAPLRQLLVVPFHNGTLDSADPDTLVLSQLKYALNLLWGQPVKLSVYPLSDKIDASVEDLLIPQDQAALAPVINNLLKPAKKSNPDFMNKQITATLDQVINKAKSGQPTTVVLLQAQAFNDNNHVQWVKLRELLEFSNVKLSVLSVEGNGTATVESYAQGLRQESAEGNEDAMFQPFQENAWTQVAPNARAAMISLTDQEQSLTLLTQALLFGESPIPQESLTQHEGFAEVLLPRHGVSNVRLSLSQVSHPLKVTDGQNNPLEHQVLADDDKGHQLISVAQASAVIRIYQIVEQETGEIASPAKGTSISETQASETQLTEEEMLTVEEDQPVANHTTTGETGTPEASASPSPNQTSLITPEPTDYASENAAAEASVPTQGSAAPAVSGIAYFQFALEDHLSVSLESPTVSKNKEYSLQVTAGNALINLHQDGFAEITLAIGSVDDPAGNPVPLVWAEQSQTFQAKDIQSKSGQFWAQASAKIRDYYLIQSPRVEYKVINHEPIGTDDSFNIWVHNPFDEQSAYYLSPENMFSDEDGDQLHYLIAADETQAFSSEVQVPDTATFLAENEQISFVPSSPQGEQILYVKASDGDSFAQAKANITWSSVYEALKDISLGEPVIVPAEYEKGTKIRVAVALLVPEKVRPKDLQLYLEHINITASIVPVGEDPVVHNMVYDKSSKQFVTETTYPLPNKAFSAEWYVEGVVTPENAEKWPFDTMISETKSITVQNVPPVVLTESKTLEDLEISKPSDTQKADDKETGTISLDLTEYFEDADNQPEDIVYGLLVFDEKGQRRVLEIQETAGQSSANQNQDGENAENPERPAEENALVIHVLPSDPDREGTTVAPPDFTRIENTSAISLVFSQKGQYRLVFKAMDQDDVDKETTFVDIEPYATVHLRVTSQHESRMLLLIICLAAFVVLILIVLIVIRIKKPTFAGKILFLEVKSDVLFPVCKQIPLAAWNKRPVPLQWIILYCAIPLYDDLKDIADSATLVPLRRGVMVKTSAKATLWEMSPLNNNKKMVLKKGEGEAVAKQGNTELKLKLVSRGAQPNN